MPDAVLIDPEAIENLRALNPEDGDVFVRELIGIFLEDTPQRLLELEQGITAGDVAKFSRAAHSIKGSSSNLGAEVLRREAEQLEYRVKTGGIADLADDVAGLKAVYQKTKAELERLFP
jgi:HPt (histidine-containing phosphotransfer) domain-containing protein